MTNGLVQFYSTQNAAIRFWLEKGVLETEEERVGEVMDGVGKLAKEHTCSFLYSCTRHTKFT